MSIFDVFLYFGISSQAEVCSWVVQQQYISQVQLLQSVLPHPNQWCQVNNVCYIIYLVNSVYLKYNYCLGLTCHRISGDAFTRFFLRYLRHKKFRFFVGSPIKSFWMMSMITKCSVNSRMVCGRTLFVAALLLQKVRMLNNRPSVVYFNNIKIS